MEPWIETYTGKKFWFTNEDPNEVDIEDIAHALSHMCRYTGHCNRFYSVAEHSVRVSYLNLTHLEGLLHDASEAYLADIASPVKQLLPEYKALEERIMRKIAKRFGLKEGFDKDPDVKWADWVALRAESKILLRSGGKDWYFPPEVANSSAIILGGREDFLGWPPEFAYMKFMARYNELKAQNEMAA